MTEIVDCACGQDHETMPMIDVSWGDGEPVLVGGDKAGRWKTWYRKAIPGRRPHVRIPLEEVEGAV